jgi:hypothetical protein
VTVTVDGKEEKKEFPDEGEGVKQEVAAWAAGLKRGEMDEQQSPQEALQDMRVVSLHFSITVIMLTNLQLEAMLRSGEENGTLKDVEY